MFCPVCSQEQVNDDTRFCSRCGFLLTGVSQLIADGGVLPQFANSFPNAVSPRKKGLKQGGFLFFSGFVVVPLLTVLTIALHINRPYLAVTGFIFTFMAGLARMLYAAFFESNYPTLKDEGVLPESLQNVLPNKRKAPALSPQQSVPISSYAPPAAGNWRETNDLAVPPSVTEPSAEFLQKEE